MKRVAQTVSLKGKFAITEGTQEVNNSCESLHSHKIAKGNSLLNKYGFNHPKADEIIEQIRISGTIQRLIPFIVVWKQLTIIQKYVNLSMKKLDIRYILFVTLLGNFKW